MNDPNPGPIEPSAPVRVRVIGDDLTYDTIKRAIYEQARFLSEHRRSMQQLLLSRDIYEILNRRLVFKNASDDTRTIGTSGKDIAIKELSKEAIHFITPFGNLRVEQMDESLDEPLSFIIE